MSTPLHSLVYVSTAVQPFSPEEPVVLLSHSRERNQQSGITGMLLYKSGCFLQAIEGEPTEVRRLQLRIATDPRHCNLTVLQNDPIETRDFSAWTMGFKHLSDTEVQHQPGFGEMVKMMLRHGRCSMDKSAAIHLLRSFVSQPA